MLAVASALLAQLGSLQGGLAPTEQALPTVRDAAATIQNNPWQAPYTIVQLLVAAIMPTGGETVSRLPSVLIATLTLSLVFYVLNKWHGARAGYIAVLLIGTSAWFLHVARLATPLIVSLLFVVSVLAISTMLHSKLAHAKQIYLLAAALALSIYVPGGVLALLVVLVLEQQKVRQFVQLHWKHYVGSVAFFSLLVAPVVRAMYLEPAQALRILGIHQDAALMQWAEKLQAGLTAVFVGGSIDPSLGIVGLPLISVFTFVMFVAGISMYAGHFRARRTRILAALMLVTITLSGLPYEMLHVSIVLPIIAIIAVSGILYLLHKWLTIFPKNPLARGFGFGVMYAVLLTAVAYNATNYFVAWPSNEQTKQTFTRQL